MLTQLISAIADWPVIVQGAVGSALFWAVLQLGQRTADYTSRHWGKFASKRQQDAITDEALYYLPLKSDADIRANATIYGMRVVRALHRVVQALMWLVLGLITSSLVPVFGIVGYLGALYYLLSAFNTLKPRPKVEDVDEKVNRLIETAKKIVAEENKTSAKPK